MGKYHPTVSRRDFMKGIGLAGAGLGVAAAASPVFRDLDEMAAASEIYTKKPWWIKTRDHLDMTTEVDWNQVKRYSEDDTLRGSRANDYKLDLYPQTEWDRRGTEKSEKENQWLQEGRAGWSLKDFAFSGNVGANQSTTQSFLGPQKSTTPEGRGVAKWQGTKEEAAAMLRTFLRFVGAMNVGFVELEEANTKKFIYDYEQRKKVRNIWVDDDKPSINVVSSSFSEYRIPNSFKHAIVIINQESMKSFKVNPTQLMAQIRYQRNVNIQAATMEFIRSLGYQAVGQFATNAIGIGPALATVAGLGEMGRVNRLMTPEHGPVVGVFTMLTNLPLPADNPIDAGYLNFCRTCMKCADACGEGALSFEKDPYWETIGPWNNPGHKTWFEDSVKCTAYRALPDACTSGKCLAVCTFSKDHVAAVHEAVQMTVANTGLFNGFFKNMDDIFYGEGLHDPAKFWEAEHPIYGIDTTIHAPDTHA
ncbi:MAG: reductive dehalogenase [Dehalogenimonas sp.]|uniref:Reductive dehalogenase n=1 Tax=Candidatus Dehalogenimonas loeffleri TaxID=3127115 RepID=A0ABZ2J3C2_9CHLR|nr:reductive dehalogenase [Dehalogenimonas sp.]